jgi:Amt family ammonium transporter
LLAGVFATAAVSKTADLPNGLPGLLEGNWDQMRVQVIGIAVTAVWCGVISWILLKLVDATFGLRVGLDEERMGLDVTLHGEAIQ